VTVPSSTIEGATPRQLAFIADLGGDPVLCRTYSKADAHKVIDNLMVAKGKKARMSEPTPAPSYSPPPTAPRSTTETKVVLQMLDLLPDGYYAWTPALDADVTFLRVKRYPVSAKNRWRGGTLVQTQHSDELIPAWFLWPSGRVQTFRTGHSGIDIELIINGLIVDHKAAAHRYAMLKGNCCICNKELTDPRSRHYGIGPDCEKTHQYVINEVDSSNDDVPWEHLAHDKV
jgi:hypothetical protein